MSNPATAAMRKAAAAKKKSTSTRRYDGTALQDKNEASAGERILTEEERAKIEQVNGMVREAFEILSGVFTESMPIGCVRWVHVDQVQANDYNPNAVAGHEMRLLHTSISEDGFTSPVVTIWDPTAGPDGLGRYIVVDGFHRYTTMKRYRDLYDSTGGYLPIVVIDKPIADRIASTVRHNRARGKHSVTGMSNLVFQMLTAGETDEAICNKIGVEPQELARLKHITGYSKLYANSEYSTVVLTRTQAKEKAAYKREHPDEMVPRF